MESESNQVTKTDVGYEIPTWNNWSPLAKFYHPLQAGSIDGTDAVPHDRAVTRAMLAKYKPNKRVTGDPDSTLFVGKLSKETSEATLYKVFAKCGELTKCRLVRDVVTGFSKGYAFVEYRSDRDAVAAWREMHSEEIDGCNILVEYVAARALKGWIPRRLGGGFGGKKESGQLRFGGRERPFRRPIPSQQGENQHRFLRGSRDHEGGRVARDNPRDSYRERKSDNARDNYTHRERDRDRDGSREKRERDRENSRSSSYHRGREGDSGGKKYRERDSERSRDRGGERYKDRERHRDSEGSRSKERHGHRDKRRETYEASDKRKDSSDSRYEPEEGEV